jgi:ATP-binding cassette subfamily B protein
MILASASELYTPIPMRQIIAGLTPSSTTQSGTSSVHFSMTGFILFGLSTLTGAAAARLRDMAFGPVSAETELRIGMDAFQHLQKLSLSFHLRRETGGILRSISRGAGTYSALIKSTMFILLPMLIKVVVTCIIFAVLFQWYFFAIIVTFLICYIIYSMATSVWRDWYRRIMNEKDNEKNNRVFGKYIFIKENYTSY